VTGTAKKRFVAAAIAVCVLTAGSSAIAGEPIRPAKKVTEPTKKIAQPTQKIAEVKTVPLPRKKIAAVKKVTQPTKTITEAKKIPLPRKRVAAVKKVTQPTKVIAEVEKIPLPRKRIAEAGKVRQPTKVIAEVEKIPLPRKKIAVKKVTKFRGIASVYNETGTRSASGEIIKRGMLVAAHRSLRFGTKVRVTNRRNGRSVIVRIIDRGPFVHGRVIDLSPAAAHALGFSSGLVPVTFSVLEGGKAS
jgi:peptidoglycan lytic transglycosylase